jgi:hypothetical protein
MTVVKNEKNELIPQRTVTDWWMRMIIENLTRQQKNVTFHCPSLMKCWSDWQTTLSFVFLMGI